MGVGLSSRKDGPDTADLPGSYTLTLSTTLLQPDLLVIEITAVGDWRVASGATDCCACCPGRYLRRWTAGVPMRLSRRQTAFTLVEVAVASAISALVMLILWTLDRTGMVQTNVTQNKLDALRSSHLLFEVVHRDLKGARHVVDLPAPAGAGHSLFFIDGKEYRFDRKSTNSPSVVSDGPLVGGHDFSLHTNGDGSVHFRIATASQSTQDPTAGRFLYHLRGNRRGMSCRYAAIVTTIRRWWQMDGRPTNTAWMGIP